MSRSCIARLSATDPVDRFACASAVLSLAERTGLSRRAALELSMAAAELASNAIRHAGGGVLEVLHVTAPRAAIEIVCRDEGPGITDPERALIDGYSRGRMLGPDDPRSAGLGTGLGSVRRAVDELHVATGPAGTTITARKWAARI
jgi:serine/threonine-protein kinase RsbT